MHYDPESQTTTRDQAERTKVDRITALLSPQRTQVPKESNGQTKSKTTPSSPPLPVAAFVHKTHHPRFLKRDKAKEMKEEGGKRITAIQSSPI
jgi:hypothetical protein